MPPAYTTANLLADVKLAAMLPDSGGVFTDSELLTFATNAMDHAMVPLILSAREEYLVDYVDYAIVAGQQSYAVPEQAIGGKLRDVTFFPVGSTTGVPMTRLALDDVDIWSQSFYPALGAQMGFCMQRSSILVVPTPTNAAGTLRVRFYRRPGRLALVSECAQIVSVTNIDKYVVNAIPATFVAGVKCDAIKNRSQFDWVTVGATISSVGVSVDFSPGGFTVAASVGDWLALEGFSPIPQIPVELHDALSQATVAQVFEAMGDRAALAFANAGLKETLDAAMMLLTPRVDGAPQKIVNRGGTVRRNNPPWWFRP